MAPEPQKPDRHRKIREIFENVLDLPEADRLRSLNEICGADRELFRSVELLLTAHAETSEFLIPRQPPLHRVGRYVILRELGRGGMGIVYEASDPLINRALALKIIHLANPNGTSPRAAEFLRERLFREARSAGGLSHPGIVTVFDVGHENGITFIAMERVNGPTLQQMLAPGAPAVDWATAIGILRQIAAALDYAHVHGVIHRDVKPANIMLHEGSVVKIADFGIAKILSGTTEQTGVHGAMGTPSHISPEQIRERPLDGRSDQFSLAVVAFRLLAGAEPFASESPEACLHKIVNEPRPLARVFNPSLPAAIDDVLHRGLQQSPELRFGTCSEFVWALENAPHVAPPIRRVPSSRVPSIRYLYAIGIAAALSSIMLAALSYSGVFREPANRHEQPEPIEDHGAERKRTEHYKDPDPCLKQYQDALGFRNAGNTQKAIDGFRHAADCGYVPAMVELGEAFMYESGGVPANYSEAHAWLLKAAKAGNTSAMLDLGGMCLLGEGGPRDYPQAADWFERAAKKGNANAMFDLGTMYEEGKGVPRFPGKAKQLYQKAAALGVQEARRRLTEFPQ